MQPVLQLDGVVADNTGGGSGKYRRVDRHVAGGGSNRREPSNGPREQADKVRLLRIPPLDEQPRHGRERGGAVGNEEGGPGDLCELEFTSGVEAFPIE